MKKVLFLLSLLFSTAAMATESSNVVCVTYKGLKLQCSYKGVQVDSAISKSKMEYSYTIQYDATITGVADSKSSRIDIYDHQSMKMEDFATLCPKAYKIPFSGKNATVTINYKRVNDNIFCNLKDLNTLYFGSYTIMLNDSMFIGCNNLKTVYIEGPVLHRDYTSKHNLGSYFPNVERLYINGCVHGIGKYAFYGCKNLKYVSNTYNVTLGDQAFGKCTSLNSFFPNNLKNKYPQAFDVTILSLSDGEERCLQVF